MNNINTTTTMARAIIAIKMGNILNSIIGCLALFQNTEFADIIVSS
jgi:hypothetical protein